MKTPLKKKIQFSKYSSLLSKNSLFFVCLMSNHKHFSLASKELRAQKLNIKFSKNKLIQKFLHFTNVKKYLSNPIYLVYKKTLEHSDFSTIKNILLKENHVILFYLDNKFYSYNKLNLLFNDSCNTFNNFSTLCSFYLLIKLGFLIRLNVLSH